MKYQSKNQILKFQLETLISKKSQTNKWVMEIRNLISCQDLKLSKFIFYIQSTSKEKLTLSSVN